MDRDLPEVPSSFALVSLLTAGLAQTTLANAALSCILVNVLTGITGVNVIQVSVGQNRS